MSSFLPSEGIVPCWDTLQVHVRSYEEMQKAEGGGAQSIIYPMSPVMDSEYMIILAYYILPEN